MEKENYDDNSLFRIIPPCQYEMQDNIRNIISSGFLPDNVNVDYENFKSELETNLTLQNKNMGQEIRYGAKFQLYQHSSKRYLSIKPADDDTVINAFENGYTDSLCYQPCFSEYPSEFTHFTFEECCLFQKRKQTSIKDNHYLYLVSQHGYHSLYAFNVEKQLFMTESEKTPISVNIVKESDTFDEVVDVQNSELVAVTYANSDLYLNYPSDDTNDLEQNLVFEKFYDYTDIDINGWFSLEYDVESEKVYLKHFNTGKFVTIYNKIGIRDRVVLTDEKTDNSQLIFDTVDSENTEVIKYTFDTVFKIMSNPGEAKESESFVRVADEGDKKELSNTNLYDEMLKAEPLDEKAIPIVIKQSCPVNKYDTFNLLFPQTNTYRELMFCKDIKTYLNNFIKSLNAYDKPLEL